MIFGLSIPDKNMCGKNVQEIFNLPLSLPKQMNHVDPDFILCIRYTYVTASSINLALVS